MTCERCGHRPERKTRKPIGYSQAMRLWVCWECWSMFHTEMGTEPEKLDEDLVMRKEAAYG